MVEGLHSTGHIRQLVLPLDSRPLDSKHDNEHGPQETVSCVHLVHANSLLHVHLTGHTGHAPHNSGRVQLSLSEQCHHKAVIAISGQVGKAQERPHVRDAMGHEVS